MTDPRPLTIQELPDIVKDPAELAKGARVFDEGGLLFLSRHETKIFCESPGSGAAPYRVSVTVEATVRGRCSCFAARTRPFCKHAAGLVVAWARTPEAFAVSTQAPMGEGGAKPKAVKKGKTDANALLGRGAEQVVTLVGELGVSGTATLGADRAAGVRSLAAGLRDHRLRRLSARALALADMLEHDATTSAVALADLLADLLLSARRVQKHVEGDKLEDKYVEELIGKTWTKKDRTPIEGLELVEVSYRRQETADGFVISASRFVDVTSGAHYAEKQIMPTFLARRSDPKPSYAGLLVHASGSLYPGFPPRRIELQVAPTDTPLDEDALLRLRDTALPSVGDALAALADRKKDVFAPDLVPVSVRANALFAMGKRLLVVDDKGEALFFPSAPIIARRIAELLSGVRLVGVVGDVGIAGALPTLFPHALLVDEGKHHALRVVVGDADSLREAGTQRWVETARAANVSPAAVALGEAREELADALVVGLSGFTAKTAAPIAQRLKDLGLAKPGQILLDAAAKPDPRDRLDDVVRVHQVTGIALTRLAGAISVDRKSLEPVPTLESVFVTRTDDMPTPSEVAARAAKGTLNRFEAAVRYARWYATRPMDELLANPRTTWADGAASLFVARAIGAAANDDVAPRALAAAQAVLAVPGPLVARLTAVRVLRELKSERAIEVLCAIADTDTTTLRGYALQALIALGARPVPPLQTGEARRTLLGGAKFDERLEAVRALVAMADVEAIPLVRTALEVDPSARVRHEACVSLGALGDVDSFDRFLELLASPERGEDQKSALRALGALGDARAVDVLLRAYAEGTHANVALDALRGLGVPALPQLLAFFEKDAALAKRQGPRAAFAALPTDDVVEALRARIEALPPVVDDVDAAPVLERAAVWWSLVDGAPEVQRALAPVLREKLGDAKAKPAKALLTRLAKAQEA